MRIPKKLTFSALSAATLAAMGLMFTTLPAPDAFAQELKKVNMSHATATTIRLPFYIAYQNGDFEKQGIDLQIVDTRSGSDAMKMLAGGSVQISSGQLIDVINLNNQGIHVQGIALLTSQLGNSIIVRKDLAGEIKSMKDAVGRTVGVTGIGSGTWQFAVFAARVEGVDPEKLNFVPVGGAANVVGAVKAGRVDLMSYADPENYKLVQDGDAEFLIDMTDPETHKQLIGDVYINNMIMTTADYAKQNPEIVQGVVNAIQSGLDWANSHSPEEVATVLKSFPGFAGVEYEFLLASLDRMKNAVPESALITQEAYDSTMKLPITVGVVKEPLPYEQLINTTFAQQAAK